MEQICLLYMQAEGHGATESAAAGLCMQVLTLSRDMAFVGKSGRLSQDDTNDLLSSIYQRLGTTQKVFHIKVSEYVHFMLRHGRPC